MLIHRIKSAVLRAEGHKFETTNRASAERKLAELKKRDPLAKLLIIGGGR